MVMNFKRRCKIRLLKPIFTSISLIYKPQCRFRNLSPSQKIVATAIKNPHFLQNFSNCLPYRSATTLFNLQTGKSIETLIPNSDQYFEYILSHICIGCCCQSIFYLKECLFVDDRFIEWLDEVSNFKLFEYNCEGDDNLLWYSSKTYHSLSHSIVNQFQKQINRYFYHQIEFYHQIQQLKQFCRLNNKNHVLDALEIPILKFVQMPRKDLHKILEKVKIQEDKLHAIKAQQIFQQMQNLQKGKKSRKKGKKKISNKQLPTKQQQKQPQINLIDIEIHNQNQILKIQEPATITETKQQQVSQQKQQSYIEIQSSSQKQQNLQIPNECFEDKQQINKKECTCFQETQHSQQFTHQNIAESQDMKQSKSKKKRRKKQKRQQQIQNFKKDISHKFMTRQLENIVQFINSQTNKILQGRVMAFERVRIFIQNTYPFSNAILFGSNAIGLSLPESDVDILLIGFQCSSRTDSGELLNHIGYLLNCMGWVINCEVYFNAKVPVIKLQIDTSVPYMQIKGSNYSYRTNNNHFFLQTQKQKIVKVDITVNVEGISSAGYDSTLLMKKWLQKYPFAQKIIILFKHILSYKHLNQNYRGGIGSYCLFVMVMAYIQQYSKDSQIQISKLFVQLLLWYSEQFNSDKQIVWLREDGPCFLNQQDYQKMNLGQSDERRGLLRLVDPTTKRIMSGSCSQYIKIKAFFKEILQQFMAIQEMVLQELNGSNDSYLELVKIFQNKKQSEKWFRNTNERHGWAVKNLLGMKD